VGYDEKFILVFI